MAEMNKAAALAVMTWTELPCVTLKVSEILFKVPIRPKDIYTIDCYIGKVGKTSFEVRVVVSKVNPLDTLDKLTEATSASFTMVTVNPLTGLKEPHGIQENFDE